MRNFDRESFYELLSEDVSSINMLFVENNLPNFETYDKDVDVFNPDSDDQLRLVELFQEIQDIINRNQ